MTCRACESRLDAYLDRELDGRESLAVRDHVSACVGCRAELESLRELKSMLARRPIPAFPEPPIERYLPLARTPWEPPVWGYAALAGVSALVTFALLPRADVAAPLTVVRAPVSRPATALEVAIGRDQTALAAPDPTCGAPAFAVSYVGR